MAKETVTLFHSELVKIGKPVSITPLSEPKKSKFPNKPDYVEVIYEGKKRQYWLDNPALADFFVGQIGRPMFLLFEGSKNSEVITFCGESVPETAKPGKSTRPAPKQKLRQKPRQEPPPPRSDRPSREAEQPHEPHAENHEDPSERYLESIKQVKLAAGRETVLAAICCDAAEVVAKRHEMKTGKVMPEERIQGIAMRMMITLAPKAASLPSNLEKWLPVEKPKTETSDNDGGDPK